MILRQSFGGIFDLDVKEKRLQELHLKSENPDAWNNPSEMQKLNKEKSSLEKTIGEWSDLKRRIEDGVVLLEMAVEAEDEGSFQECKTELQKIQTDLEKLELKTMLNGETDMNNAYLTINSGAGGTEAQDWALMLFRMFTRYAEAHGFKVEVMELTDGDTAGIKSATIMIEGPYAYGYLKGESGVHRLVRISPFDSNARRHTSFSAAFVWPEIDDTIEIEVKPEDLRVDTYRAGGAGGQHVNKTDSAVRLTHLPTGVVVQCQNERSQHANRDRAMKMLKAALYEREVEERNRAKNEMNATKKANEWGSQIRSYVLHPYQMVKDHRTGYETSQSQSVLDGDLDGFIESYLKFHARGEKKE